MADLSKKLNPKKLRAWRLSKAMTQAECAQVFGVSLRTYERIEAGRVGSDLTRAKINQKLVNLSERASEAA